MCNSNKNSLKILFPPKELKMLGIVSLDGHMYTKGWTDPLNLLAESYLTQTPKSSCPSLDSRRMPIDTFHTLYLSHVTIEWQPAAFQLCEFLTLSRYQKQVWFHSRSFWITLDSLLRTQPDSFNSSRVIGICRIVHPWSFFIWQAPWVISFFFFPWHTLK